MGVSFRCVAVYTGIPKYFIASFLMPMLSDFGFTPEQKMMRESLLKLARRELPDEKIRQIDEEGGWPVEAYQAMARDGWIGLLYPEEYGGLAGSYKDLAVLLETLSYHYACLGTTYMTSAIYAGLQLLHNGSEYLKREYMMPMIQGKNYMAFALTEPQTGSDAAAIKTHAVKKGGDYILSGQKWFITSALMADYIVVVAKTDTQAMPVHNGFSLFLVDAKAKGVSMLPIRTMGRHTTHTNQIYFDEVRVPQRYRIGNEGQGFIYQMQQFQEERLWAAASCLQSLSNCIQWTIDWAQERKLFGSTLADQQWVQFKLAECKTEVEALRALTYRACDLYVQGQDVLELASMAKLKAGRLNRIIPDTCLQFWGGMGFTLDNKVSRMYRDGRLGSIGGGADEVMMGILAKLMGIAKRPPQA